ASAGRRRRARPHAPPLRRGAGARAPRDDPRAPARRGHRDRPDRGLPRRGRRRLRADARLPRREPALLLPRLPVLGAQRDHRREARRARAAGDARRPRAPLEAGLGHRFARPEYLAVALTHRSFGVDAPNNEKLEFLGDAVLALAMSDLLMTRFPDASEGELSKIRASLVNADVLARKAR